MQGFIQRVQYLPKRAAYKAKKWMEQQDDRWHRRWLLAEFMERDLDIFSTVTATTYILRAVTGLGYLALMWSTVVLLGGFVTVLQKKDFWSVTIISMVQAVSIFNDLAEHLVSNFISLLAGNVFILSPSAIHGEALDVAANIRRAPTAMSTWRDVLRFLYRAGIALPFRVISLIMACLYGYSSPVVCIALALWRVAQRDYGGDGSSNLVPALYIFYCLVLFQGGMYLLWTLWPLLDWPSTASKLRQYCRQLGQPADKGWCHDSLARYVSDTRARCWRDPASIRGRTLHHFAIDLLDSGSWGDVLSGVRLLDAFVKRREDVRSHLLASQPRIQKLIQALGWRDEPAGSSRDREMMREPAARVVAHLVGTIHLAQFPGAIECISSLLILHDDRRRAAKKQDGDGGRRKPNNELILQGLAILEGLASFDHHNCRVICSTPGLLHKIMAPLSSADMVDAVSSNRDWANVVSRSLMVLCKLMKAPGKTSRRLRREIHSNRQSMSNLRSILDDQTVGLGKLQKGALEILTQLALDSSIDLARETKQKLVRKLLHIFIAHDNGDEAAGGRRPVAVFKTRDKERAGRTLVLLSTRIERNCGLIMTTQIDITGRLTGILFDPTNTTKYRTIAAQVLENLCNQCDFDKEWVKEILLPKVLAVILSSERGTPKYGGVPLPPSDEESQQNSEPINHDISTQQGNMEIPGTSSTADRNNSLDTAKQLWEPFLSLALVIRDKLISADDFDDAVRKIGLGPGAFVAKMKIIVEENCQEETAESLRIVKLCGRIVEPMMQRDQYAQHFRNKQFVASLSKASEIMSNLESCMLFAGTDFGPNKATRPLLSHLKKRSQHLVGR